MKRFHWQKKSTSKNKRNEADPDMYWSQLKSNSYSGKLGDIQQYLEQVEEQQAPVPKAHPQNSTFRRLYSMKEFFTSHKLRLAGAVLSALLVVVACNYPVEYTETVGHMLTLTVEGDMTSSYELVRELGMDPGTDISYKEVDKNGVMFTTITTMLPGEDLAEFDAIIAAIDNHPKMVRYNLTEVDGTHTEPAYKAALRNVFHLSIDLEGMTEADIARQIEYQLQQQGAQPTHIDIVFHDDGRMEFFFEFESSSDGQEELFEINMVMEGDGPGNLELDLGGEEDIDGDGMIVIKEVMEGPDGGEDIRMLKISPEDLEGLTQEEIQAFIKKQFEEAGLPEPDNLEAMLKDGLMDVKVEKQK